MGKRKKDTKDFNIINYGLYDQVTGSSVLVEVDGVRILFELGMFQSSTHTIEELYKMNGAKCKIPLDTIDFCICSHFHADHIGMLPLLIKSDNHFNGKIMVTEASTPLISMILKDSAHIQAEQCKAYNKKAKKPLYPFFNMNEAEQMINHLQGYRYNEKIRLTDKLYFEFIPNGHTFGSSSIYLTYMKDEYTNKHL